MKVVACTPTKNRKWTWEFSKHCMEHQIRPADVWIVVDNSDHEREGWADATGVVYEHVKGSKTIGWLRNRCLDLALKEGADYIVFWDDDDYYPPTRISSGVAALEANPQADIAGSSKMFLLLTRENVLMTTGPFHDKHATASTMTVRRSYAQKNRFDGKKTRGEEVSFTKNWTATIVQLVAEEVVLVMGHGRNTVDKSDLLHNPGKYSAVILNSANGRMVARLKWPQLPWGLFRSTFSV